MDSLGQARGADLELSRLYLLVSASRKVERLLHKFFSSRTPRTVQNVQTPK